MKFKIAVAQLKIKILSPEYNLKRIETYIRKASNAKANIVIFPEDCVVGMVFGKAIPADSKGKYRKHFQHLAKKYNIDIVTGSIIEKENSNIYNTAYYVDSNGKVKGKYRKINLWHLERHDIKPGKKVSVFNTKYGRIGLIICWDLAFPEIFRKIVKKGADIVICTSYWCHEDAGKGLEYDSKSELKFVDSLCVARAYENEIIMVYCNAAGEVGSGKKKDTLIGHSQIAVPFKGAIKKLNHNKEAMFVQEVETSLLKSAEKIYKIRKDLKEKRVLC